MSKGGRYLSQKAPKPAKKKTGAKVLIIVLVAVLLLCAGIAAFVISKINKINRAERAENQLTQEMIDSMLVEEETEPTTAPTETEPPETEPEVTEPDYGKTGKIVNVLVVGQDARIGEDSKNADTVILLTVNKETKVLTMTSFLRDTLVYIPEFVDANGTTHSGRTKITLAYALGNSWGGSLGAMELMDSVIERNFGPNVDRNIEIDFDAFDEIINAIGGIYVNLNEDEVKYLENEFKDMPYYVFNEGECRLDGWSAEVYARMRHSTNADNDFNRTDRQRAVISGVVDKCRHMSISELNNLVDTFLPKILTDMSNEDIATYMLELLPLLPDLQIASQQCPSPEMERYGKLVDLFGDGVEHSVLYFTESKAKEIMIPITEG